MSRVKEIFCNVYNLAKKIKKNVYPFDKYLLMSVPVFVFSTYSASPLFPL